MISTRNLTRFPEPQDLKKLTKALAMLDAIIEREWEYRYYSFNSKWSDYEEMASMRNGQGDGWYCVFSGSGVFLKGFDHESSMSPWSRDTSSVWPGVLTDVPAIFQPCATEPAFSMSDTTYCIWREHGEKEWRIGNISFPEGDDPDGSEWMLSILDGNPLIYKEWAEQYYERTLDLDAIKRIYEGAPLTPALVSVLNPEIQFETVLPDALEVGYPARS
jgi:hypothetical protein